MSRSVRQPGAWLVAAAATVSAVAIVRSDGWAGEGPILAGHALIAAVALLPSTPAFVVIAAFSPVALTPAFVLWQASST